MFCQDLRDGQNKLSTTDGMFISSASFTRTDAFQKYRVTKTDTNKFKY